jgi:hypothetical protein
VLAFAQQPSRPRHPNLAPSHGRVKKPGASADTVEFKLYDYEIDPLETKNLVKEKPRCLPNCAASSPRSRKPSRSSPANPSLREAAPQKPKVEATKPFRVYDKDGNGTLSREEYVKSGCRQRRTEHVRLRTHQEMTGKEKSGTGAIFSAPPTGADQVQRGEVCAKAAVVAGEQRQTLDG